MTALARQLLYFSLKDSRLPIPRLSAWRSSNWANLSSAWQSITGRSAHRMLAQI